MKLKCNLCGKQFNHLGSHIWHAHKVLARDYKAEFGLPYNMALTTPEIREKQQASSLEYKTYERNFKGSKKFYFKKGKDGHRRISEHERKILIERIKNVNKNMHAEKCPVCKMEFKNLASHLFMKHNLLRIYV